MNTQLNPSPVKVKGAVSITEPSPQNRIFAGEELSILRTIARADAHLSLWNRSLPSEVAASIVQILETNEIEIDQVVPVEELPVVLITKLIDLCGKPSFLIDWLAADMEKLGLAYASLIQSGAIRLRLSAVRDDGCAKFHVDTLALRLLCTYAGPGTQWVCPEAARPEFLGYTGVSLAECNRLIVPDEEAIETMPTGAVAVFKGRLHPQGSQGLIHRSHPVCCAREHRLRLTLDAPDSPY